MLTHSYLKCLALFLASGSVSHAKKPEDRRPMNPFDRLDIGYCVLGHVGEQPDKIPTKCDNFLHEAFPDSEGDSELRSCGRDNVTNVERTAYNAGRNWDDPEHCRAGCETCMIAMEDKKARSAVCRRQTGKDASCGVGVVVSNPMLSGSITCLASRCDLNSNPDSVYAEFGFGSKQEALDSGALQVEWDKGFGGDHLKVEKVLDWTPGSD